MIFFLSFTPSFPHLLNLDIFSVTSPGCRQVRYKCTFDTKLVVSYVSVVVEQVKQKYCAVGRTHCDPLP